MLSIVAAFFILLGSGLAQDNSASECQTIDTCLAILIGHELPDEPAAGERRSSGIDPRPIEGAVNMLAASGDNAAAPLVMLLRHPLYHVRNRAAYTLFHFPTIDPRHVPDMILAHNNGVHWLEFAIARTNSDEALAFLQGLLVANPHRSNVQVKRGLVLFGERNFPFLFESLERCKTTDETKFCDELIGLLSMYNPMPRRGVDLVVEIYDAPTTSEEVRLSAEYALIRLKHQRGLDVLIGAIEQTDQQYEVDGYEDFDKFLHLRDIGSYGPDGRRAGKFVRRFLKRQDLPDARAQAALTLGQIGYAPAIPELTALRGDFDDDWLLAYNVVESLSLLEARRSQALLTQLAIHHWSRLVRNNAGRALQYLDTGKFFLPGVDEAEFDADDHIYFGSARYSGDYSEVSLCSDADSHQPYRQYMAKPLENNKGLSLRLNLIPPTELEEQRFFERHPDFEKIGAPVFVAEIGSDAIVGVDHGEFGGGVYRITSEGDTSLLISENASAVWWMGEELLIFTGLAHLALDDGHAWFISPTKNGPVIRRKLRLHGETNYFVALPDGALVAQHPLGDIVIRADGSVHKIQEPPFCVDVMNDWR